MHVLVTAASREGSTLEIAESIGGALRRRGLSVTVAAPAAVHDVTPYDAAIVGSAVYAGHWLEPAVDLVRRDAADLHGRPVWLFSSGPVGDPGRSIVRRMATAPQELPDLLRWSGAREHRSFGGRLSGEQRSPIGRLVLLALRLAGDWRPWNEIDAWSRSVADELTRADWFRRLGDGAADGSSE